VEEIVLLVLLMGFKNNADSRPHLDHVSAHIGHPANAHDPPQQHPILRKALRSIRKEAKYTSTKAEETLPSWYESEENGSEAPYVVRELQA
jgi:hypothetical protein